MITLNNSGPCEGKDCMIPGTCQSTADGRYCECIAPQHKFDSGFDCVGKYDESMLSVE